MNIIRIRIFLSSDTIEHTQNPQKTKKQKKNSKKIEQTNLWTYQKFPQISQLEDPNKNTVTCDYYNLNDFNKVIVIKQDLAVLHLNISSLSAHINELKPLLSSLNLNFTIRISESRIIKSNVPTSNIHILGYNIEQKPQNFLQVVNWFIYLKNILIKTGVTSKYTTLNIWNPPSLKSSFQISPTVW